MMSSWELEVFQVGEVIHLTGASRTPGWQEQHTSWCESHAIMTRAIHKADMSHTPDWMESNTGLVRAEPQTGERGIPA